MRPKMNSNIASVCGSVNNQLIGMFEDVDGTVTGRGLRNAVKSKKRVVERMQPCTIPAGLGYKQNSYC